MGVGFYFHVQKASMTAETGVKTQREKVVDSELLV